MKKITVKELETEGVLEDIFDKYEKGDETVYEVFYDDGKSSNCVLTKYNEVKDEVKT
jgi:hypothetical protein